jgi:OFA family oxalate/formate antiporter-like MFS transporter
MLVSCIIAMMAVANLQYAWTLFTLPLTKSMNAALSAVQIAWERARSSPRGVCWSE